MKIKIPKEFSLFAAIFTFYVAIKYAFVSIVIELPVWLNTGSIVFLMVLSTVNVSIYIDKTIEEYTEVKNEARNRKAFRRN